MDRPRCGTPMDGGVCPNCGLPVIRIAADEKKCEDESESKECHDL